MLVYEQANENKLRWWNFFPIRGFPSMGWAPTVYTSLPCFGLLGFGFGKAVNMQKQALAGKDRIKTKRRQKNKLTARQ